MQLQSQELLTSALAEAQELGRAELACEVLSRFGQFRFRAYGTSMLPAIWPGDLLEVERADRNPLQPSQLQDGQVWLTQQQGKLVAHRVVSFHAAGQGGIVWLRGDFLDAEDPALPLAALLGRVVGVIRYGRLVPIPSARKTPGWFGRLLRTSHLARTLALRLHHGISWCVESAGGGIGVHGAKKRSSSEFEAGN